MKWLYIAYMLQLNQALIDCLEWFSYWLLTAETTHKSAVFFAAFEYPGRPVSAISEGCRPSVAGSCWSKVEALAALQHLKWHKVTVSNPSWL